MKTATIERYMVFHTPSMFQALMYRGQTITDRLCQKGETTTQLVEYAKNLGFTHIRFIGDWRGISTRKTMKIQGVKS